MEGGYFLPMISPRQNEQRAAESSPHGDTDTRGGIRYAVIQTLVVLTTFKWVLLALIAGVIVGFPTAGFLLLLDRGIDVVYALPFFYFFIPVGLLASYLLVSRLAPDAKGHGTEQVIEAIHHRDGEINLAVVPVKMLATLVTLILGGSAGKEGPSAQIGAAVASGFARLIRMNKLDKQRFVLCGISAGFAGVFGTPIAGAIFASEVLSIGRFHYNRLLPALIASYVSTFVTRSLGVRHLSFDVGFAVPADISMLFQMVIFGLAVGLLAVLFIAILTRTERFFHKMRVPGSVKALIGGAVLVAIVLLTGTTNYVGLGMGIIDTALDGEPYRGIAPLFKMLTTSVTLSAGGSGGILTPIFFIGATAGNIWAQMFGTSIAVYSAVGMVSFLAATTNTPVAAAFLAIELFGLATGTWAAVAAAVAFLVVGHASVFPSQIIYQKKTFFADLEVHDIPVHFTLTGIRRIFGAFFRGYRDYRDESAKPGGISVAESEQTQIAEQIRPRAPGRNYYPLSTVPHVPKTETYLPGDPEAIERGVDRLREYIDAADRVCVLTGAGISAECGLPTFRDAQTGYWAQFDSMRLATLEAFRENPARSWSWYAARRLALRSIDPCEGHIALGRLENFVDRVTIATQNVDGLHQRAGSTRVLDLHGNILRARCMNGCTVFHRDDDSPAARDIFAEDIAAAFAANNAESEHDLEEVHVPVCPECGALMRPDVVWFGELLPAGPVNEAFAEAERCDLFLSVGTSAQVQPAASLPIIALERGVPVVEVNPGVTPLSERVTLYIRGRAGDILSRVV